MTKEIHIPTYYLVGKADVVEFRDTITLGRKEGNIVLKFDASSGSLKCFQERNKSKALEQHFYINELKVTDQEPRDFRVGDVLKFSFEEYKLYDEIEEVDRVKPKHERRRYKRPKNAYDPLNFVNFYCAPPLVLSSYIILLLGTALRFFHVPRIHTQGHLSFLSDFYNNNILLSGLQAIGIAWSLCLIHSFLSYLYFNRNPLRRFLNNAFFLLVIGTANHMMHTPFGSIRGYLEARESLWHESGKSKLLLSVVDKIENQNELQNSFIGIQDIVSDEDKTILKADFEETLKQSHQSTTIK